MNTVDRARQARIECDWAKVDAVYSEAGALDALTGSDHAEWGMALYWLHDVDAAIARLETAIDRLRAEGEADAEARALQDLITIASWAERDAVAGMCIGRVLTLMEDLPESEAHALTQWSMASQVLRRDLTEGAQMMEEALAIALRVQSRGAEALALMRLSQIATYECRVEDAMQKADAAAALALGGEVKELHTGGVLCGIVWSCRNVGDWDRAAQWTDVATRWAERVGVSMYPGQCQFHRCEIMRVRGDLADAEQHAIAACAEIGSMAPASEMVGYGYRELGMIRLVRGDSTGAVEALGLAARYGVDPNPPLAMLRLREGDVVSARRGLEDALNAEMAVIDVPFLLPVLVTACIADDDLAAATVHSERLTELADRFDTDCHHGSAAYARAEVAFAAGDLEAAGENARLAWQRLVKMGAPYDTARAQELSARVEAAAGAAGAARFGLESARASYLDVGATFDAERLDRELNNRRDESQTRAFMFTDIVESTRLQGALGDERWYTLLQWHDRVLGEMFEQFGGEVIKHEGDGFFVAFASGADALAAACRIQVALAESGVQSGFSLEVRIGVHEGEATPRDGDWIGMAVTMAARVAAAGGAGEVICTDAVLSSAPMAVVAETRTIEAKGVPEPVTVHLIANC